MSKHGNVESEPVPDSRRHMNSSIGSSQSASRSEDEYKLIDETFSSTERSDCSVVDNETFLKDEDMRQNGRYTKHYGNFYQPTVYHSMARRQLKNPNDDSLSDHDDRISGSHKEDIDYRRPPAQWSSGHHRPSLLGNYVDPSTPSCSETQPKYSFYRPKRSYSNLPKTSHKAVYSPRSSSSIPDEDRIFSPRARDAGSSFIPSHQISPENCPETPSRFRNKSRDQPLLGNPNLPLIPHVNSNTPNIPGPGLLPMTAGYNVQPLYVVPSVNLWSLTHNFYSQTVNLFSQPEKPWQ
ncbi:unnamed protein product [Heterobilharzia americana]|nr:unnamed protein product [Heterobilharzia americana]